MELYNFFTEIINEKEEERFKELKEAKKELQRIFKKGNINLVLFTGLTGERRWSIIGQIYGSDTNIGDTDLYWIFDNIKYTWFDAFCPSINNI